MKSVLLITAILLFASAARTGEVLKWVDERGVVHFTDNAASVPEKYRKQIDRRELPEEMGTSSEATREVKETGQEPRDRYGRGEDYWGKKANEVKNQLGQAQKEYERIRLQFNDLVAEYNATRSRAKRRQYQKRIESLQQELNHRRQDMEEAKELLEETLPEEAKRAGAPAEWVK
jgi:predicted  nucleic acid-binding Zn-ribbon protein